MRNSLLKLHNNMGRVPPSLTLECPMVIKFFILKEVTITFKF